MTLFEKSQDSGTLSRVRSFVGDLFSNIPLEPNHWTILSFVVAVIAAVVLTTEQYFLAALLIIISGGLDLVDGAVARARGTASKWGAYLDTITDRYTEFFYILPLLFLDLSGIVILGFPLEFQFWVVLYLFGAMMTTYAKASAKEKELGIPEIRGGLIERAERVSLLIVGIIAAGFDTMYLVYMVALLAILANISAIQRIRKAYNEVHEETIEYVPEEPEPPKREVKETDEEQTLEGLKVPEEKEERKLPFSIPTKKEEEKKKEPPALKI